MTPASGREVLVDCLDSIMLARLTRVVAVLDSARNSSRDGPRVSAFGAANVNGRPIVRARRVRVRMIVLRP